jgi:alkanesulfonate monooxygenase SsuD/methylene tetrahydromethanopterin reductase-like flavin-dependent oxidoreductase (luciferase family)
MEVYIYHPTMHRPETAATEAARMEALGYDGLAMPDHLFVPDFKTGGPNSYAHGVSVLAACAVATSRVRLTTLVADNLLRSPVELAHAVATLSRMSGGRMDLGLGAGWFRSEHEAEGVPFPTGRERIERLEETVQICRSLFEDGCVDFEGRHYRVEVPKDGFIPLEHRISIMVGAAGPRIIRAAARIADRVDLQPDSLQTGTVEFPIYNSYNVDLLKAAIDRIKEIADSMGRKVPVSESPFVFVAEDAREGAEQRREMADWMKLDQDVMDRSLGSIVGAPEEVAERLSVYAEAGCDRVHVQALHGEAAERLAPYLPQLQAL